MVVNPISGYEPGFVYHINGKTTPSDKEGVYLLRNIKSGAVDEYPIIFAHENFIAVTRNFH